MLAATLFKLALLAASGVAQDIESDDFPSACQDACSGAVGISSRCDDSNDDDDAERNCVCTSDNAQSLFSDCVSCAKAQGKDDNDSDIAELVNACGWDYEGIMASGS
ncbi:hypothetical protein PG985_011487 [Apiospora marii]|uniref:uncharacterized protein n=1 Tax=Apiospora marii TaxID=335849 RepID=UPI003131B012